MSFQNEPAGAHLPESWNTESTRMG